MLTIAKTQNSKITKKHIEIFRRLKAGEKFTVDGSGLYWFADQTEIPEKTLNYLEDRVSDLDAYQVEYDQLFPEEEKENAEPTAAEIRADLLADEVTAQVIAAAERDGEFKVANLLKEVNENRKAKTRVSRTALTKIIIALTVNHAKREGWAGILPNISRRHGVDQLVKVKPGTFALYSPEIHGEFSIDHETGTITGGTEGFGRRK